MVSMPGTAAAPSLLASVRRGDIGAVILYAPNFASTHQLQSLTGALQAAARAGGNPPLLIAIDQEGGAVKRLPGPPTRSPAQMVATGRVSVASEQGLATGGYLRQMGINLNIAPIVDVPTSRSSFMYQEGRTFSFNATTVATYGTAFAMGQQSAGVGAAAGLFPGLGAAKVDTDLDPHEKVYLNAAQRAAALKPYEMLIPRGLDAIMVANAVYPAYDPEGRVADLSGSVMGRLLRDKLRFNGVIITDAMVRTGLNPVTAGVVAAEAGADILTYGISFAGVLQALESAYRSGHLSRANAVSSFERIVALKRRIAR
jgi:beta-N-acetylhexosaminidase